MDLLSQMATFVRVVDAGNLSAAARAVGLSVPAVSRQISALELSAGGVLLLRTTRKLTVTEGGRRYYEHCLRVLREVEAAQSSLKRGHAVEGLLVVTAPVTLGLARVSPHLPSLLARHPGLQIDLRLEDRVVDLVGEGVDVAIRAGAGVPDSASLVARRLLAYDRVVVASPQYLERRGEPKTPDALAGHDAIVHLGASGVPGAWRFLCDGSETAVEVRGTVRSSALYALRDAAVSGLGVALLPDWLVVEDLAAGRLRLLLEGYDAGQIVVNAVHRTDLRASRRLKAFLDHYTRAFTAFAAAKP